MRCVSIRVTGQVQGVSFREFAKGIADELGLDGFVRNEPDGSVYIEVEGEEGPMEKFTAWCRQGPEHAKVEKVEVKRQPLHDFDGFQVERNR